MRNKSRIARALRRLNYRLFPEQTRAADQLRAAKLREDNRKLKMHIDQWQRCDDCARYFVGSILHFELDIDWGLDDGRQDGW